MEATGPSSPSFNSYSSASVSLTETAARVVEEFGALGWEEALEKSKQEDDDDDDDDGGDTKEDEFEFAFVCNNKMQESPISADEIFFNGQIKPLYPPLLFDRPRNRSPLGKLMREERENNDVSISCSSSEAGDDLDSLQPGTYCVWTPEAAAAASSSKESSGRRNNRKSHSTGSSSSSKRWNKLRDLLLHRSNSDGKDTFVFITTHDDDDDDDNLKKKRGSAPEIKASRAVQKQYVRNRSIKEEEEDKKRSFLLPYKHDWMGFFNDSNGGFTKNLLPI